MDSRTVIDNGRFGPMLPSMAMLLQATELQDVGVGRLGVAPQLPALNGGSVPCLQKFSVPPLLINRRMENAKPVFAPHLGKFSPKDDLLLQTGGESNGKRSFKTMSETPAMAPISPDANNGKTHKKIKIASILDQPVPINLSSNGESKVALKKSVSNESGDSKMCVMNFTTPKKKPISPARTPPSSSGKPRGLQSLTFHINSNDKTLRAVKKTPNNRVNRLISKYNSELNKIPKLHHVK